MTEQKTKVEEVDVVDGVIHLALSKGIPDPEGDDGDELMVLKMREPTAADVSAVGMPVKLIVDSETGIEDEITIDIVAKRMRNMAARLSRLPTAVIGKMSSRDFSRLSVVLMPYFFGGDG